MAGREESKSRGEKEKKEDRTYLLRCYYNPTGEGETMSTLLPIAYGDLPADVATRLLDTLSRRGLSGGVSGEAKAKHLRVCTIMETHENNIYAVPKTVPVARTVRKSLLAIPEAPQPIVGAAVVVSLKELKNENDNFDDDSKTSSALQVPPRLMAFLAEAFPVRARPAAANTDVVTFDDGTTGSAINSPRGGAAGGGGGVGPNNNNAAGSASGVPPPTAPTMKLPPGGKKMPVKVPPASSIPPAPTPAPSPLTLQQKKPAALTEIATDGRSASASVNQQQQQQRSASLGNQHDPATPTIFVGPSGNVSSSPLLDTAAHDGRSASTIAAAGPPRGYVTVSASSAQAVDCVASVRLKVDKNNRRIVEEYLELVADMEASGGLAAGPLTANGSANGDATRSSSKKGGKSGNGRPALRVSVVYYRGDAAVDVIRSALGKMRSAVAAHLNSLKRAMLDNSTASHATDDAALIGVFEDMLGYLSRLSPHAAMLALSDPRGGGADANNTTKNSPPTSPRSPSNADKGETDGGADFPDLLSYSGNDPVPAFPARSASDPTVPMVLVDMGPDFIPKLPPTAAAIAASAEGMYPPSLGLTNGGEGTAAVDPAALEAYSERLRREQMGVKELPSINYANRDATLSRLSRTIEAMLEENSQLEAEIAEGDAALAALETEAAAVAEAYYSAKGAAADIPRLKSLQAWLEEAVADRKKSNTELQQRVLLGDDYEPVAAAMAGEGDGNVYEAGTASPDGAAAGYFNRYF